MPVIYGDFNLRPGPRVDVDVVHQLAGDGRRLADTVKATLTGTIVPEKIDGVEAAVDLDGRLSVILQQQKRIRDAFSVDGLLFQVQGWDDGVPMRFPARVADVRFQEGDWVGRCDYTIELEGPAIAGEDAGLFYVASCSESWQFEEDEQTWLTKVVHAVDAKGLTKYDGSGGIESLAWENARDFALGRLKLGWSSVGDAYWSPLSGEQIAAGSAAVLSGSSAWNPVRQEQVDEIEGTYRCTETFYLSDLPYWEEYRASVKTSDAEPMATVAVSISGVIHGLFEAEGDFAGRYANALDAWESVRGLIAGRAADAAGSAVLSGHPLSLQVDHSERDGTISYAAEFNNRPLVDDAWESYTVTPRASVEDYRTTVAVQGTITGVLEADSDTDPSIRLTRALARWDAVKGLMLARAVQGSGVTDLKAFPVSASYTPNGADGTVSYQYEFDNRTPEDVEDQYTVSTRYSRETGQTTVSIEGTIKGLRTANPASPFGPADRDAMYAAAAAYWAGKEPNLLGIAALAVDTDAVNPTPWAKSVSHSAKAGQLSYQYEFSSMRGPCTPGALSESRTIVDTYATPVFASLPVPGKPQGPITQDMATITAGEREVTVEVVFPPGNPCAAEPPADVDLTGMAPSGGVVRVTRNVRSWNPSNARLTRTMAWYYTQ